MSDSRDHAILTKINELAYRYGLKDRDFLATVRPEYRLVPEVQGGKDVTGRYIFQYEQPPTKKTEDAFNRMIESLAMSDRDGPKMVATDEEILAALDHALNLAPKRRSLP